MTGSKMLVAVDVGNTAIKVAVANVSDAQPGPSGVTDRDAVSFQSFSLNRSGWDQRICDWVKQQTGDAALNWLVASVNQAASGALSESVSESFYQSNLTDQWQALCHQAVPLRADVDAPDRVGIDRLVSAYAASIRFPPPVIVVDAGSAVTVDLVKSDPWGRAVFAGGAIFPGIRLQHAALATGTEGLRRQTNEGRDASSLEKLKPAANTEEAICVGVLAAVAGGVERLAQDYAEDVAEDDTEGDSRECATAGQSPMNPGNRAAAGSPRIVVTGGDGPAISAVLRAKHDLLPDLVCLGMIDLATRQCQIAPSGLK